MINQTERDALDALVDEIMSDGCHVGFFGDPFLDEIDNERNKETFYKECKNRHSEKISELIKAATAYARQDERAKVIEIVKDMMMRWIRNNEIQEAIDAELLMIRMCETIHALSKDSKPDIAVPLQKFKIWKECGIEVFQKWSDGHWAKVYLEDEMCE